MNDDRTAELLGPITANVQDLSLARCAVTDKSVPTISRMGTLRRLDLSRTGVTDAGIASLATLAALEELNLVGTAITDAAIRPLAAAPSLKRVFLWGTRVSPAAIEELRAARPGLVIEAGTSLTGRALETEGPPVLAKVPQAAAAATPQAAVLTPVNTKCPVTGTAVDPRYVILYEGRPIGFCCPNCPKKFWDDPAQYLKSIGG
jgi:YHS domain-containing protein